MADFALTPPPPAPTMQPESSDGLASVGTILPEEMAAEFQAAISISISLSAHRSFTGMPGRGKLRFGPCRRSSAGRATDS